MGLSGVFLNSQSPQPLIFSIFWISQSVLVWWGTPSDSLYLDVFSLLIVLKMRGRTTCGHRQCYLGCSIQELKGASGKWTHPFLQDESGFTFLGFMLLSVCCITFKCKAKDDSFKIPPGTIHTGICPC